MVFLPPSWLPDITDQIPPSTSVGDFVLGGRRVEGSTRPPLICAVTGNKYTADEVAKKVENLAKALCQDLEWSPNHGSAPEKVVGLLSGNSVCSSTLVLPWFYLQHCPCRVG
jgi:hypothetical protein